jgi:hypothetical protein
MGGDCHAERRPRDQRRVGRYADLAGSFASASFKQLPNPFAETICNRARRRMHLLVLLMIAVFMFMYLGLAVIRLASG